MDELFLAAIAAVKERRLKSSQPVVLQPEPVRVEKAEPSVNVITTDGWDIQDVEVPDEFLL